MRQLSTKCRRIRQLRSYARDLHQMLVSVNSIIVPSGNFLWPEDSGRLSQSQALLKSASLLSIMSSIS